MLTWHEFSLRQNPKGMLDQSSDSGSDMPRLVRSCVVFRALWICIVFLIYLYKVQVTSVSEPNRPVLILGTCI